MPIKQAVTNIGVGVLAYVVIIIVSVLIAKELGTVADSIATFLGRQDWSRTIHQVLSYTAVLGTFVSFKYLWNPLRKFLKDLSMDKKDLEKIH